MLLFFHSGFASLFVFYVSSCRHFLISLKRPLAFNENNPQKKIIWRNNQPLVVRRQEDNTGSPSYYLSEFVVFENYLWRDWSGVGTSQPDSNFVLKTNLKIGLPLTVMFLYESKGKGGWIVKTGWTIDVVKWPKMCLQRPVFQLSTPL